LEIGYLNWWNFPKKAWLIIIGELGVITSLSIWLYSTYLNDIYFQTYANSLSPILVPVLSVAFGISSASIATYLYLGMKRIRTTQEPQVPVKNRVHPRKTSRGPTQPSTSRPRVEDLTSSVPAKLRPIAPLHSHIPTQKPPLKERDPNASNPETKK
jgi:hypothetical protein